MEKSPNTSLIIYILSLLRGREIAGLEDAFIMFNNLFKTNLDLYVGQFQVSDPLLKEN